MNVSVLQENLAHGLNIVSRAVAPRSTLPVLANVLVATDEGRLRLSATNLELGITCWIGAKIQEEGSTTVPARTFTELVNTLSDQRAPGASPAGPTGQVDLSLSVRTQTLNVRSGSSNTDLKCIDSQEFPPMPAPDVMEGIQINITEFKEMIHQVAFAASADEARPVLTGVYLTVDPLGTPDPKGGAGEASGSTLILAAADGFRLSVRKAMLSSPISRAVSAIIPARALTELARIAGDGGEGDQAITMILPPGRGQVIFRIRDIELVSQLIEGNFPPYEQIIPRSFQTRSVLATTMFLKACKQAEIFAREGSHITRINITPGGELKPGNLLITGQSEETGSNETEIIATVDGKPLLIAFNVKFLREVLDVIKTPEVALETSVDTAPGVIRPVGEDNYLHVIMPMHLGS
jgi:DNA polymerase-3 subunit beta